MCRTNHEGIPRSNAMGQVAIAMVEKVHLFLRGQTHLDDFKS